jgi:hypothetical protein
MAFARKLRLGAAALAAVTAFNWGGAALPSSAAAPTKAAKAGAAPAAAPFCTPPAGTRPTLRRGSTGPWVTYLQCSINEEVGFEFFIDIDGDFGYQTLAGVLWLQVCEDVVTPSGFSIDGEVGSSTWSKVITPDTGCRS